MLKYNTINRRVYDTEKRGYATVVELRDRLLGGEDVYCLHTREDKTTQVLQWVLKADIKAGTGPTSEMLREFIRSYVKAAADQAAAKR